MREPLEILKASERILLVDWPGTAVPRTLIEAGFSVFGSSPAGYSRVELVAEAPDAAAAVKVYPPEKAGESGFLVFRKLDGPPSTVDIVNVYRPEEEHAGIIANRVIPLAAKVLWLHPPITSVATRAIAADHGITFVQGIDIAETARLLKTNHT